MSPAHLRELKVSYKHKLSFSILLSILVILITIHRRSASAVGDERNIGRFVEGSGLQPSQHQATRELAADYFGDWENQTRREFKRLYRQVARRTALD